MKITITHKVKNGETYKPSNKMSYRSQFPKNTEHLLFITLSYEISDTSSNTIENRVEQKR